MTGPFRLYPEEMHFLSFADYGVILSTVQRLRPATVLEFGPGHSTLALIEGGAQKIDACEDQPPWLHLWQERHYQHAHIVTHHTYAWSDPLAVASIDERSYDLALIDGPFETAGRPAVIDYCLQRCAAVLVPLEEHEGLQYLRPIVWALAEKHGRMVETWETGPLAGAFALLTSHP